MHDVLLGFRLLGRAPGVAAAAIASIALGIGASTAIFSVVRHVVVAPLPYDAPDRLLMLWETSPDNPARWVAPANFLDWQREMQPEIESMAAFDSVSLTLTGAGEPERLRGASTSGTFFTTLGQAAAEGRVFDATDDRPDAPCVALLSAGLRARRFAGADVVGTSLILDGRPCLVVGLLPATFQFALLPRTEIWTNGDRGVPRSFPFPGDITTVRDAHLLFVVARLRPGKSAATADAHLQTVAARLADDHPTTNADLGARVMPLHDAVVGDVRTLLWLLQGAVLVLLVVAAANVAHLLMGRAVSRRQELAVRVSLGAGRADLARQMCCEALAYALPGGVIGVIVAAWGVDALVALAPAGLPRVQEIRLDAAVLAVAAAVTLLTTFLVGLVSLVGTGMATAPLLNGGARVVGTSSVRRWHRGLVMAELALAQVVVVGAWMLAMSLAEANGVALGYDTSNRVAAELALAHDRYGPGANGAAATAAPIARFVEATLEDLRGRPSVRGVAAAFTAPLSGAPNRDFHIAGEPEVAAGRGPDADFQVVTPTLFATLGIPVIAGRPLAPSDDDRATHVAVINEAFAARYFPDGKALGRVIEFGQATRHEIVGIVANTRYRRVESAPYPSFYVPLAQSTEAWPFLAFVVWADGDAASVTAALRAAVRRADPAQAISSVRTLDAVVGEALAGRRFNTWLFSLFAITTMALAVVGAYGVTSALAAARAREFSIRAALGAPVSRLRSHIVGDAMRMAGVASAAGLGISLVAGPWLEGLLFEVTAHEPWLLASAAATVALSALAAAWPTAWRVGQTTPGEALRLD